MTHRLDRGDIIDMLEESILKHTPLVVELDNNHSFEDRATQIFADGGEDHVTFHQHETVLLRKIARLQRAVAPKGDDKPPPRQP